MRTVHVRVNGREIAESIDERTHLADFLRKVCAGPARC
jgi:aerobic-type carbon monoxide dehydrogenase small subunit (CoxS/CutS family)